MPESQEITSDLITVAEAAKLFRRSKATINNWIHRGVFENECPPFTMGAHQRGWFFRRSQVEAFIQKCQDTNKILPQKMDQEATDD